MTYRSDHRALEHKARLKGNCYAIMMFTAWGQAVWTHPTGYPHWDY